MKNLSYLGHCSPNIIRAIQNTVHSFGGQAVGTTAIQNLWRKFVGNEKKRDKIKTYT